jgi:alpha-glucoside transport system permease protein
MSKNLSWEHMTPSTNHITLSLGRVFRAVALLLIGVAVLIAFVWSVNFMRDEEAPRLTVTLVAIIVGVLGVWGLFWASNSAVTRLSIERLRSLLQPYVFVGPALILLFIYLVFPAINTIYLSLFNSRSENFVGLANFIFAFTEPDIQIALRNNLYWLVFVTSVCVSLGLVIAALADRVRYESVIKSLIFLPMAISFVGASVIWRFIYAFAPASRPQIGLLNAVVTSFGGEPVGWLIERSINNFALIAIMIWLQTGFSMVIMSAAVKGVPQETIESARIDGANGLQIFFLVIIPQIRGTIITVATTILVAVLKVFDVIYVMTNGQFDTEVIANRMFAEMFRYRDFGHGSALAVILLVAVIPIMIFNVRNLRNQRS